MTKDEMKNRISMALKDPILQQGFECICKELEAEKKLNEEIKVRFVKCNTCTDEMKDKCIMFSENLCEGERCEELVDLMELINKSDLQKENAELKSELTKKADTNHSLVEQMADLEHENALLKGSNKSFEQQIMGLLIKYEEVYKRFPDLKSAMDDAQVILKENTELKEKVARMINGACNIYQSDNDRLRKENAELQKENKKTFDGWLEACYKYGEVNLRLTKAKDIIKNIIRVTWGEGWNYDLGWKVKAEQFLKEDI